MGRAHEMAEVKRALAVTRLLTLTGVGGSGKTRLALEVARDLVGDYQDGVWLVELASLSEGVLVPKALADALEVPERPAHPLTDALVEAIGSRHLLVVLDNCEHLIEPSARMADALLDSCPGLRILATSREALGVEGEVRWAISPLPVPRGAHSPKELEGYESVRLFVERARERDPAFTLGPHTSLAVAEICGRLEGIPLAIELAAARIGVLSVQQIAERLTNSLKLLTGGGRTAAGRQRTLKGILDWSHELLSEYEKILFERLSVFAGGWTLEAAENVTAGEGIAEGEIFDPLSGLVEKSLVVVESTEQGRMRYRLLELIRQYALEKLEHGGKTEEMQRRHATFFLALAEEAEPRLQGPEDMEWFQRLEDDQDNIRAALSWMLERAEAESALRLAAALCIFWRAHGKVGEGRTWLEAALAKGEGAPVSARARALVAVFWLTDHWDLDRAEAVAQESLKLSEEAEIGGSFAASLRIMLAAPLWSRGDYERAEELCEESLALSREAGDKVMIAEALLRLGRVPSNPPGDLSRARGFYEEGIALCREVGYTFRLPAFLLGLGYVLLLEGDYGRGAALNEEAAALCRERGYNDSLQYALDNLGWAALLQGDYGRARSHYEESLVVCKKLADRMIAAESLEGLACVAGAVGEAERAARLVGAAEALREPVREAVGYRHRPEEAAWREPYLGAVRSILGETVWEEVLSRGRAMDLQEAIDYALFPADGSQAIPLPAPEHPAGLTSREVEVLELVASGMTSPKIAKKLFLSPRTVDTHLTSIYHKLGVNSRTAATRYALDHGLA